MGCRESWLRHRLGHCARHRGALLATAFAVVSGCSAGDNSTRLNPQPEYPVLPRSAGTQQVAKAQGGAANSGKGLQGAGRSDAKDLRSSRTAVSGALGEGGAGDGSESESPAEAERE